jgi:hypothetical protein
VSDRRCRWDRQTEPEDFERRERELADLRVKARTDPRTDRPGVEIAATPRGGGRPP